MGDGGDIAELVRLRRLMWSSMGAASDAGDDEAVVTALAEGLPPGRFFAAVVDGRGYLAASGIGMVARRVPGPGNPSGRYGYIQSMATDERHRRSGLARLVLAALMARFAELEVATVDLHASAMGEPLHRVVRVRPRRPDRAALVRRAARARGFGHRGVAGGAAADRR